MLTVWLWTKVFFGVIIGRRRRFSVENLYACLSICANTRILFVVICYKPLLLIDCTRTRTNESICCCKHTFVCSFSFICSFVLVYSFDFVVERYYSYVQWISFVSVFFLFMHLYACNVCVWCTCVHTYIHTYVCQYTSFRVLCIWFVCCSFIYNFFVSTSNQLFLSYPLK